MKKIIALVFVLASGLLFSKSFEGKLVYKVEIDFITQKVGKFELTKEQIIKSMKEEGSFYDTVSITLKAGNYLKEENSKLGKKVIYKSDVNKIFTFQNNTNFETVFDANNYDAIDLGLKEPKIEKLDSIININGIKCKLLKLSWDKIGDEYYFYNSDYAQIDPKLFKAHNFEYFNTIVENTNSYPLEIQKTIKNFIAIKMTLVSISEEPVNDAIFDIERIKSQKSLALQNKETAWSLFKDEKIGYTVEYPEKWVPQGSKGGFICGAKKGFANAEFTIVLSDINDKERIDMFFNNDAFFQGYDVVEKPIKINGIDGVYYLRTHKNKPNEYHESIVLKTESTWYSITNSGEKNPWFERFYKSFKLVK